MTIARLYAGQRPTFTLPLLLALGCTNGGSSGAVAGGGRASATGGSEAAGAGKAATGGSALGAGGGNLAGGTGGNGRGGAGGDPATDLGGAGSGGARGDSPTGVVDIYWIDVEGGAATIVRVPNGQIVLADTGNAGDRDAGRILKVLADELQASKLDHVIISHYHSDHVGGVEAVAAGIEIGQFIDHGASLEGAQTSYLALAAGRRRSVVPGDTVELGDALITVVAANAASIATGLPGSAANPFCAGAELRDKTGEENGASVGYVLRFGTFQFMDLGDLTWGGEHELACPVNKLGEVDLMQVPHHGLEISSAPQLFSAVNPLVAVLSNSPSKGNAPVTHERLLAIPALQDVWQIHQTNGSDAAHNAVPERIANLNGAADAAHFIHARVEANGRFSLENSRNGQTVTYQAR